MSQMFTGELTAALISLVFAVWDLRIRKAPRWMFALVFAAGCIYSVVSGRMAVSVICSTVPGILLMVLSVLTEGGIGIGDGLFYVSVAGFLSPKESFLSLLVTVLLAFFAALFLYAAKKEKKASLPFLALAPLALFVFALGGTA